MKRKIQQAGYTVTEMVIGIVGIAGVGGWIANIVKLCGTSFSPLTGMAVLRVVGIFVPPLGAILGYL